MAEQNYRWNMDLLLAEAGRRGIPVILCQVATNYRFAHLNPIASNGPGDDSDLTRLLEYRNRRSMPTPEGTDALATTIDRFASQEK